MSAIPIKSPRLQIVDRFDPVTEEDVRGLERRLNLQLPDDYRRFLLNTNGGHCSPDAVFPMIDEIPAAVSPPIASMLYGITDLEYGSIEYYIGEEHGLDQCKSLAIGGGDCLMLRIPTIGPEAGSVLAFNRYGAEDCPEDPHRAYRVAPSFASFFGSLQIDPELLTSKQSTTLFRAAELGDHNAVGKLLDEGADPDAVDDWGDPLLIASLQWPKVVARVLAAGADVHKPDKDGRRPITRVFSRDLLKLLFQYGANPNELTPDGSLPLLWTVGAVSILEAFLANGADPNMPAADGTLPLEQLLRQNKGLPADIERQYAMLIEAGADVQASANRIIASLRRKRKHAEPAWNALLNLNALDRSRTVPVLKAALETEQSPQSQRLLRRLLK